MPAQTSSRLPSALVRACTICNCSGNGRKCGKREPACPPSLFANQFPQERQGNRADQRRAGHQQGKRHAARRVETLDDHAGENQRRRQHADLTAGLDGEAEAPGPGEVRIGYDVDVRGA